MRDWLAAVALASVLLGCDSGSSPAPPQSSPSVTITDRLNRIVAADQPATRIVSLSPATTELLFALDLGPSIVGATRHCNYPKEALGIPRVGGGTLESLSTEAILAAKPDLVLAKWDSHQPLVQSLDRMHVRSLAIGAQDLSELFEETKWLGQLTGRQEQAERFIAKMKARREQLVNIVEKYGAKPKLKVFYEVWDDPLITVGPDSFIDEILELAGLQNIVTDTSIRYPRISAETVLRGDPDLILAPTTHFEDVDIDSIRSRPGWSDITAVRSRRIHLISGDEVSRCGPRLLDALAEIISAAYPNVSADDLLVGDLAP
jgi:iron complex transport system substrate-binding protein